MKLRAVFVAAVAAGLSLAAAPSAALAGKPKAGHHVPKKAAKTKKKPAKKPAKKGAARSYFLGAEPHVPLAVVRGERILEEFERGTQCGNRARWAKAGSRWIELDAWGQPLGEHTVERPDFYDVTKCYELSFDGEGGKLREHVFVSADSAWRAAPSVRFVPSKQQAKRLEELVSGLARAWVDGESWGDTLPFEKRTLFFDLPKVPDGETPRAQHWAVVGGPVLVVARLNDAGAWKVSHFEGPLGMEPGHMAQAHTPIAVFDMNGDGLPEVVTHSTEGTAFGDDVLGFENGSWRSMASSPGGGTL